MRDHPLRGLEGLHHLLVVAAALDGRAGADVLAHHAVQMVLALEIDVALHEIDEVREESDVPAVLLIRPVQAPILPRLLGLLVDRERALLGLEEPRFDSCQGGKGLGDEGSSATCGGRQLAHEIIWDLGFIKIGQL